MPSLRRNSWVLVVATLFAVPALARAKPGCKDRCVTDKTMCVKLCTEQAGGQALGFCKKACADGENRCDQKCAKKGSK